MRPRNTDGSWALEPFQPTISGRHNQFYCEGNAWTYTWLVQHDVQGLINLMGGPRPFIEKLDEAFEGVEDDVAYYDPTNEPDMHYPYLYNHAGAPWRSQEMVRLVVDKFFSSDRENGLPGDDDVGTMSAFYIFSALGFYPVVPGSAEYVIGSPLFDKVEIKLDDKYYGGKTLVIEAENNGAGKPYIQSAKLNGEPLNKTTVTHDALVNNGHLVFVMGDTPNKEWGTGPGAAPTSMTTQEPEFVYSNLTAPARSKADHEVEVTVMVMNKGGLGTAHTELKLFDSNAHYRKGHLVGEDLSVLAAGESRELRFTVPLYFHGAKTFRINDQSVDLVVSRINAREYVQ
jgi:putative alpha-1,2-mannosidase